MKSYLSTLALVLLFGCATQPQPATAPAAPATTPEASAARTTFDRSDLNTSVSACDDFYEYATGGWRARTEIPAAYPEWGQFAVLEDRNRDIVRRILDDAQKGNAAPGTNQQKVGDFYGTCMDQEKVDRAGLDPLRPELGRIAAITDLASLRSEMARLQTIGVNSLFAVGSSPDFNDSSRVVLHILQSGLGLPDRDYYFKDDEKSKTIRQEYEKHLQRMFTLAGDDAQTATKNAQTVLRIETALANGSMNRAERRDPKKTNNPFDLAGLSKLTPHFDWSSYIAEIGAPQVTATIVHQPDFARTVDAQLTATPIADWQTFLRWRLLRNFAAQLSTPFVEEDFAFNDKTLQGSTEILPRWKRCLALTDNLLGEALGEQYVSTAFPPAAKQRAKEMVSNLVTSLRSDIPTLKWMSDATKEQAAIKLNAFAQKIGYPDKWIDYSKLSIDRSSFLENVMRGERFAFQRDLDFVGKPVDRTLWEMTPPTVNAYYNPLRNEIVFPAGILQPPFFDANADDAYNYGGIGAVIGHEMTHGFDDTGAQFDSAGNLKNWWSEEDLKNFTSRADCVTNQYSGFTILDDQHLNGKLVVGESIADIGGLAIAYAAYEKSLEGKPREVIDGLTPEQRFFLGYAKIWATNTREEYARLRLTVDPHPPERYRVNGVVANLPEFASAFGCAAGTKMNPPEDKRCKLW
jgi:putative endopeptidase